MIVKLMDRTQLLNKIYGGLAGIAVADAMGFPVHDMAGEKIRERFNGQLDHFESPWSDEPIHTGYQKGQVTDDTLLTLVTANAILSEGVNFSRQKMAEHLAVWAKDNKNIWLGPATGFGPSTQDAFKKYLDNIFEEPNLGRGRMTAGATNGSVMRLSPAGFAHPGDIDKAILTAVEAVLPTHPTHVSVSAACSQAAGIAQALDEDPTIESVKNAMLYGAAEGDRIGRQRARIVPSPSIYKRLKLAFNIVESSNNIFDATCELQDIIGTGLHVAETLPTAAGIFVASLGDPKKGIIAAINAGGDTDTIAAIVGALCGSYSGIETIPPEWILFVEEQNKLNLSSLAQQFVDFTFIAG